MTLEDLISLSERCLQIVSGLDEDLEEDARDMIFVGEPDLAIADTLGIAYSHPDLYAKFPDEVYELAKDPDYTAIHRYLDLLEKYREN
ncbi:hypothetical protein [Bifidobacterium catulorum]|uniref:Uncharacterized protein n=1 Tax=Bifidobacterium catulorum TaxID=1630173 RepID=A0A2U2MQU3_9BIFI|nr:hypothetical protein [Bifidobacterium catulorum]PWG59216.1 hypothetical protein DF200_08675 [Bifidobacterium catulorum]